MPDIAMCLAHECTARFKCYRYTATANPWRQTYADFKPSPKTGGKCRDFMKNEVKRHA